MGETPKQNKNRDQMQSANKALKDLVQKDLQKLAESIEEEKSVSERITAITDGTRERVTALYNSTVDAVSDMADPYFSGNELHAAQELRGTPLDEYPGVHRDDTLDKKVIINTDLPPSFISRHYEAPDNGSGALYIYLMGNSQLPDGKNALVQHYAETCVNGHDALLIQSGHHLARARGLAHLQTDVMYEHILNQIKSKIDPDRHRQVILYCYSWGGGAFLRSITKDDQGNCDLDDRLKKVPVSKVVLVDPVQLGTKEVGEPARRIPSYPIEKFIYLYQGKDSWGEGVNPLMIVHGSPTEQPKKLQVVKIEDATHVDIFEKAYQQGFLPVGPRPDKSDSKKISSSR